MFERKAGAYPSEALFRAVSGHTYKHWTKLDKLAREKTL
jgi:hypothetical protein